jgi:DNA-binding NarL/FixJ family response regulator
MNTAHAMTPTEPLSAEPLVLGYAGKLPIQLDQWIHKHGMRLELAEPESASAEKIRQKGARFVLLDVDRLTNAPDLVRTLHAGAPEARIIVIGHRSDDTFIKSMTDAGATGVVIKQAYVADLVFAIDAADGGKTFVSGVGTAGINTELSGREMEVLDLMAAGLTNQVIGERLSISVKTVEAHRARLFKKLGASNVADAVRLAIRSGLVMP